jgi:hypothetical protein
MEPAHTTPILGQTTPYDGSDLPDELKQLFTSLATPANPKSAMARKAVRDLNPHMQLCEQEFIRILFPTIGKIVGWTEYILDKGLNLTSWFVGKEKTGYANTPNPKIFNAKQMDILPILDNGLATGFLEEMIDDFVTFGLTHVVNAEELLGAEIEKKAPKRGAQAPIPTAATPPVAPSIVIKNDKEITAKERLLKGIKKITQAAKSAFTSIGNSCKSVSMFFKLKFFSKEAPAPYPKTEAQTRTDEAIFRIFHNPMRDSLDKLHTQVNAISGYKKMFSTKVVEVLISAEMKLSGVLTHFVTERLQFFRDHVFGINNQKPLKEIFLRVINKFFEITGKRFKEVNDLYYNDAGFGLVHIWDSEYQLETPIARQNRIIEALDSMKTLHPAIMPLTKEELRLLSMKNEMGFTVAEEIANVKEDYTKTKEALALKLKNLESLKAQNYWNATKYTIYTNEIANAKASQKYEQTKFEQKINELNVIQTIEDRMAAAEKAYLVSVCELIVDTFIFPKGTPFYLRMIPIVLPNALQVALHAMPVNNKLPKSLNRFAFKGKTVKDGVYHGLNAIWNRSISFKFQSVRSHAIDIMASSLGFGLDIGLKEGASLASLPLMDGPKAASDQIIKGVKSATSTLNNALPAHLKFKENSVNKFNVTIEQLIVSSGDDPRVIAHTANERIGMRQVNKHLLYSIIDAIKDQLLEEAKASVATV